MTLSELAQKKIVIAGLGENNRHLAEYFRKLRIPFTVISDWEEAGTLKGRLAEYEVIFRTPGLPLRSQAIEEAQKAGRIIYSQTKLFFDLCPAKIIAVTGTKGKGTTSTLIAKILEAAGRKVYLAGNIGRDPFEFLEQVKPEDWVVLELSSFQLQDVSKSPHIAVVLKITPEHLDYHESFEEYIGAKMPIVKFQSAKDITVLNYDSEITRNFAEETEAQIYWNSTERLVHPGCFVKDEKIFFNENEIIKTTVVKLLGRFNLENVTAAIAAVTAAGVTDSEVIKKVISEFKGLEHRLELVAEIKGVRFYNDSFATTPETTMAALTAFDSPIILIAGGSEKNSNYHGLARKIAEHKVKDLIAVGITGPKIAALARDAGFGGKIYDTDLTDMEKIVAKANSVADPGDVVLLSPASASFDMFANYKQRGELFKKFVSKLVI
ncbi:MAG: UDP-N-acetylmuramoylalanine--D-glutamate ligase [Candidatus Doudnabacteria bacterium RIFCSPHIGHO2_01_FULL_46_14]|uniref:UDP-N-acetylmuramoylalanine--D-glutamate ligase n=1 Tax=Candidatus Doudnabacteria bacterium RIFCSPHIGHO2_01_FULL_46_14 TaxID=1817824 RepID=A0A1F5NPG5_9BACT|nr:MAG: UDP-N-acetylmuramoylalanine--D-glutamate ligase [Candidatus Doudnabacteria bacterium RIFCSPHIGHO2_01_FULL_46_14]